jgi:hypothetical protein
MRFLPEAGAFYVMDRAYVDFERLFVFTPIHWLLTKDIIEGTSLSRPRWEC